PRRRPPGRCARSSPPPPGRADALSDLLSRHGFEVSIRQDALLEGTDRYNCYAVRPGYAESLAERIDWRALAP
ncbi:hypothetical protein, partial [Pseudomonas aeruginosa]